MECTRLHLRLPLCQAMALLLHQCLLLVELRQLPLALLPLVEPHSSLHPLVLLFLRRLALRMVDLPLGPHQLDLLPMVVLL